MGNNSGYNVGVAGLRVRNLLAPGSPEADFEAAADRLRDAVEDMITAARNSLVSSPPHAEKKSYYDLLYKLPNEED